MSSMCVSVRACMCVCLFACLCVFGCVCAFEERIDSEGTDQHQPAHPQSLIRAFAVLLQNHIIYSNAKISHVQYVCSVWYFMSKYKYADNDKIWNALFMH